MTRCKDGATDPKDSIDNGQELEALVKIDAAAELVGEHGGHAGDPHGGVLARPQQQRGTQVSGHSWWWSRGKHQWPDGRTRPRHRPPLPQNVKLASCQRNVHTCSSCPHASETSQTSPLNLANAQMCPKKLVGCGDPP